MLPTLDRSAAPLFIHISNRRNPCDRRDRANDRKALVNQGLRRHSTSTDAPGTPCATAPGKTAHHGAETGAITMMTGGAASGGGSMAMAGPAGLGGGMSSALNSGVVDAGASTAQTAAAQSATHPTHAALDPAQQQLAGDAHGLSGQVDRLVQFALAAILLNTLHDDKHEHGCGGFGLGNVGLLLLLDGILSSQADQPGQSGHAGSQPLDDLSGMRSASAEGAPAIDAGSASQAYQANAAGGMAGMGEGILDAMA